MKRIQRVILFSALLLSAQTMRAQQLAQVSLNGGASLSYYSILVDQSVLVRISEEGKVLEWGIEVRADRANYYAPKLQPYMGRVEFYGNDADSASRGKVRSIGTCSFYYYPASENNFKAGKIRSAGSLNFDYYTNYDNAAFRGKIKQLGTSMLTYYGSFDEESLRGKLKSVGSTQLTYYSPFDDKLLRGLVKSIGMETFNWYTSLDLQGGRGILKNGEYRRNIGGVWYILR